MITCEVCAPYLPLTPSDFYLATALVYKMLVIMLVDIFHIVRLFDQVVDVMKLLTKPHTAVEIAAYLYDDLHKRPRIRQRQASENVSKILWSLYRENLVNAYELETLDGRNAINQSHCKYTKKDMSGFDGYASPGSLRFEDSVLWLLSINKSKI